MDGYGVERSEVEAVIKEGMKWKEENCEKWHSKMAGIECVFLKQEEMLLVITIYSTGG